MTLQLRIELLDINNPTIWRIITVPAQFSFFDLHEVIQVAMGWEDRHLFSFIIRDKRPYQHIKLLDGVIDDSLSETESNDWDARHIPLGDVFATLKQELVYMYDFGDNWQHKITVEHINEVTTMYPSVLSGLGVCPPEDCGGVAGFEHCKEILEDKDHPEYEEVKSWCLYEDQDEWDPEVFRLKETQEYLMEVYSLRRGLHN